MVTALICNGSLIGSRWLAAGRPPFKSLFESLVFLAFCIAAVYLAVELLYRTRVFGLLASLGAAAALLFAIAKWDAEIVKLPPALQSAWFIPHVVVYFAGYAGLFLATTVAIVQLLRPELALPAGGGAPGRGRPLEDIAYDGVRFGYTMLTFGLFMGAVWAKAAWGDYWGWDPKENWALVSWLVYGGYLHLRQVKGWRGRRSARLLVGAFGVVIFTYLGISTLPTAGQSEHVYSRAAPAPWAPPPPSGSNHPR
jgi:ABC-type transport system involved in cytochrome c biogenesis permease subunit